METVILAVYTLVLLFLVARYLDRREQSTISTVKDLLATIQTITPELAGNLAKEIGGAVAKCLGYDKQQHSDNDSPRQGQVEPEPDDEPFLPPWEVETAPEEVKPGWQ